MVPVYVAIALAVGASLKAVKWSFPKILQMAMMKNLVDNPDARKLQKTPIPVLGGMAVYFGLVFGMLIASTMIDCSSLTGLLTAGTILFFVGMLDDFLGLRPSTRFVFEIVCVGALVLNSGLSIDTLQGLWGIQEMPYWVSVGLTIFAGVGIINAINMIDGVNGLSSGLCIQSSLIFGLIFFLKGDYANACLGCCLAASLYLFLLHNVFGHTSRMFIGDSGTMMIGLIVIWFVMNMLNSDMLYTHQVFNGFASAAALALAIMSVPVFDTLRVMTLRMVQGRSPFSADKTHLHHMFIEMGVSHSITSLCMILMNLTIVGIWLVGFCLGFSLESQMYMVILSGVLLVWGGYVFLHYQNTHHTQWSDMLAQLSLSTHLDRTGWWQQFQLYLDTY